MILFSTLATTVRIIPGTLCVQNLYVNDYTTQTLAINLKKKKPITNLLVQCVH
jgi:hypothetical protein